jgi:hypothetical protein
MAHWEHGEIVAARAAFRQARAIAPDDPDAFRNEVLIGIPGAGDVQGGAGR